MDPGRWQRAQEVFHDAVLRPDGERATFLDAACAGDAELRDMVERLLAADARSQTLLDLDRDELGALIEEELDRRPARLGSWQILEPIGRGGMGTVYRARRADGRFEREVALKVIRTGIDADEPLRRFRSESGILARLEHPNIARLYDAGVEEGQPFLVMEYVRGERIDRYCDARGLGIRERLELFLRACEAVQHAHQNLVIHRDLKPSNILVSSEGQVKLLDFGISKLVEEDGGLEPGVTRTGLRPMTIEYSSPEQVGGEPVTAATDVYSLGVVLYELLTGQRPYPAGPGPLDTVRAVLEKEASRPSVATTRTDVTAATAGSTAAELAAVRGSTPEQLARRLRGDLDTIVLKTLQKEPARRYQSVQLLLDDIRRHLEGRPVRARPDTAGYRLRKFARRNWVSLAATAAVIAALFVGLSAALWQARVASAQRDVARLEAQKANRVTDFLIGVFEVSDPEQARADTLTAAQILDRGAARVDAELATEPLVQATMMDVIGRVYLSLSLYDRADSLLHEALRRRRELLGPDDPDVAASLASLARLANMRNEPDADSLFREVIRMRRAALGRDDPLVAEALVQHAFSLIGGADSTAESEFDEARRIYRAAEGDHEVDLANVTYGLGFIRHDQGRYREAEDLYRDALGVQRARLGPDHPGTLTTMSNLGFLLQLLGRYQAADSVLQAVLTARRRTLGDKHTQVSNSLLALAELRYAQGSWSESERYARDALNLRTELYGPDSPVTIRTSFYLARVLQAEGDLDAADSLYQEVLRSAAARGTASSSVARAVNGFAGVLEARGDPVGAETFYRRALDIYRRTVGDAHPFTAIVRGNVAAMLLDQGRLDEAEPMLRESIETLSAAWTDEHETVGVLRLQLGTLLMQRGDLSEAETTMREARRVIEKALPPDHWRVAQARLRLGSCLARMGRLDEAEPLLQSAFEILEPQSRARYRDWRQVLSELFDLDTALGRPEGAARYRELYQASLASHPDR